MAKMSSLHQLVQQEPPRPYPGQAIRGAVQPLGGIAPLNSSTRGQPAPTFPSVETWGAEVHESSSLAQQGASRRLRFHPWKRGGLKSMRART